MKAGGEKVKISNYTVLFVLPQKSGGCGPLGPELAAYYYRYMYIQYNYRISLDMRMLPQAPPNALPSWFEFYLVKKKPVIKSMLLDSPCSKHQNRRLAAINLHNPLLPWPGYEAAALPRVPVASALSSMSSFLLHSLISDGRTLRVTTGLSLLMAPARQRYVRLNEKEHRRGRKW